MNDGGLTAENGAGASLVTEKEKAVLMLFRLKL